RPKQIQAQVPGRPKGGGLKQNQQNILQIKQLPIKQLPIKQSSNVIREDQIRDDQIIVDPQIDKGVLEINIQEEICSIYLTAFDIENLDGVVIPCRNNHIFYFRCIDRWSQRAITCPICRVPLQPDELWRNV
ncbi:10525_t:CDS:2, partial [Dentiscutata erythropus]